MKHTKRIIGSFLVALTSITLAPYPLLALDEQAFVKDSAFRDFGEEDMIRLDEAIRDALSSPEERAVTSWKNEASGNSGEVVALSPIAYESMKCRGIKVTNRSKRKLGRGIYNLCQEKVGGEWVVAKANSMEAQR